MSLFQKKSIAALQKEADQRESGAALAAAKKD
jgi:hypothetical protein